MHRASVPVEGNRSIAEPHRIRIAVCQIATRPALVVGGMNLLEEPFQPPGVRPSLSDLAMRGLPVEALQESIRSSYLGWLRGRVEAILAWLAEVDPVPEIVVFAECALPAECLPAVAEFARTHDAIVAAGTHTPTRSESTRAAYRDAGFDEEAVERLFAIRTNALPVVTADGVRVLEKERLSPFEKDDLLPSSTASKVVSPERFSCRGRELSLVHLVCAEALGMPRIEGDYDVLVMPSLERRPERFGALIEQAVRSRRIVAYTNDAPFGGTTIRAVQDSRMASWFRDRCDEALPAGEAVLVADVALRPSVQVGVDDPQATFHTVAVASIVPREGSLHRISERLEDAGRLDAPEKKRAALDRLLQERGLTPLHRVRVAYLRALARQGASDAVEWRRLGRDCVVPGPSLAEVERRAALQCVEELGPLAEQGGDALIRYVAACRERSTPPVGRAAPRGDAATAARPSSLGRLPEPTTAFIGRARELAELDTLLDDPGVRLLTLLGPGGTGKTRLALEAARRRAERYGDGAAMVALAPLASADQLASRIGSELGVAFYDHRSDPADQVVRALCEREALLVLDNFEHLLAGAPLVERILASAPGVQVVVTSRERLGLQAEVLYELSGMRADDRDARVSHSEAGRLFLACARRVAPGFAVSEADEAVLSRICRLVDGTPLGLQLAAGWTRVLPLAEIAAEIERSLDFLETHLRDLPERHRSLRAVFDHSWHLLDEPERTALLRLAVFRGAFSRVQAREIAGARLAGLMALADASLLQRQPDVRFDLHESVRQYAGEKGADQVEVVRATRDAHARWFADFVQRCDEGMSGGRQVEALAELDAAEEDVLAAWRWALDVGHDDVVRRILPGLFEFLNVRRRTAEGEAIFAAAGDALARRQGEEAVRLTARARARQASFTSDGNTGRRLVEPALAVARDEGDVSEEAFCLQVLGRSLARLGRKDEAMDAIEQSLARYRATGGRSGEVRTLRTLAYLLGTVDPDRSVRLLGRSIAIARDVGDVYRTASALQNLASFAGGSGDFATQRRYAEEALGYWRQIGNPAGIAYTLGLLASLEVHTGSREAHAQLEEGLSHAREIGYGSGTCLLLALKSWRCSAEGAYRDGQAYAEKALEFAHRTGHYTTVLYGDCFLGEALCGLGQAEAAEGPLREALQIAIAGKVRFGAAMAIGRLAAVAAHRGEAERAAEMLAAVEAHPFSGLALASPLLGRLAADLEERLGQDEIAAIRGRVGPEALETLAASLSHG